MTTPGATEAATPEHLATAKMILLRWCADSCYPDAESEIVRALAEAEANGLRRAAELADTFGDQILCFWDRPGGPPGNGYAPLRGSHVASAIRSLLPKEEGKT